MRILSSISGCKDEMSLHLGVSSVIYIYLYFIDPKDTLRGKMTNFEINKELELKNK